MKRKVLEYNAIFQKEDEGGYSVWIPSLPGCVSQGETFEEALDNIKEATELYLEDQTEEVGQGLDIRNQFMVPVRLNINA
ncbi:MAG: type II toxin-antitoxin system HicB family antitoxin [Candidatus Levybacteria bacterium]|nr:type II toxin-antitoxin system HicB family antitoxin [Candidatus Levybacteria bacterium]